MCLCCIQHLHSIQIDVSQIVRFDFYFSFALSFSSCFVAGSSDHERVILACPTQVGFWGGNQNVWCVLLPYDKNFRNKAHLKFLKVSPRVIVDS